VSTGRKRELLARESQTDRPLGRELDTHHARAATVERDAEGSTSSSAPEGRKVSLPQIEARVEVG